MSLDEVWYMVSPQNPLKKNTDLLDEYIRFHLTKVALEDHPSLKASDYEFHLPTPSYTWNALQNLKSDFPDDDFVLIIGGDNLANFHKWANYKDILVNYEIAVYPRSDGQSIPYPYHANIHLVQMPLIDISSTLIRNKIRNGEDITPFVPKKVAEEVEKLSLYV